MRHISGNAFFLILIAVALFAALSYAVTSVSRTGGVSTSKDKSKTSASAILNHAASLQAAITRLKTLYGCADDQFNFANNIYKTGHGALAIPANSNAPSTGNCDVYSPKAGNAVPYIFPVSAAGPIGGDLTKPKLGHASLSVAQFKNVGTDGPVGTASANDLAIRFFWLNRETCLALNDLLGVSNPGGEPPVTSTGSGDYTNGSFAATQIIQSASTNGFQAFCFQYSSGNTYYSFIDVLIAR